jgi:RNA polymerase sigma factor (TIGR02999 family)
MGSSPGEITQLLAELRRGNRDAEAKLIPLVYEQLHRLAVHYMQHERADHTLQPTALVNEAYTRLAGQRDMSWQDRAHFFGVAARLMRQILLEYARAHQAQKRGALVQKVSLHEALQFSPGQSRELIALDDALKALEQFGPRQSRVVELRFFGGLSIEETAQVLCISPRTVNRDWNVAKAWLHRELTKAGNSE